ncbi:MAG: CNP1-like family protein [Bdellovibrionales bacterium]|nr:CNP1-like family protein [Ramlibacter sp.]
MRLRRILAVLLMASACPVIAQTPRDDPDYKESDAPAAPAFEASRVIPFDVSAASALRFGVDPQTMSISKDGIVRYVVVARSSSGTINAMFEGIRCSSGEFKTYARYNPGSGWNQVADPQWVAMISNRNSSHAYQLSRQGACPEGGTPNRVDDVVRELLRPNSRGGVYPF